MKTVFLVRHGETDWNVAGRLQGKEDIPLNRNGESQAKALAQAFVGKGVGAIVSSRLQRAHHTAGIVAANLGLGDPLLIDSLHERDYGQASGLTIAERDAMLAKGCLPAGMETLPDLTVRVVAAFHEAAAISCHDCIMVISHGGVINSLLAHFSDGELGTGKTRLINCSVSKLQGFADSWRISYANVPADILSSFEVPSGYISPHHSDPSSAQTNSQS